MKAKKDHRIVTHLLEMGRSKTLIQFTDLSLPTLTFSMCVLWFCW